MSRETWMPIVIVVGAVLAIGGAWSWLDASREAQAETEHQAREREQEAVEAHLREELSEESTELLHDVLPGVALGASLDAVRAARAPGTIAASTSHADPGFELYEEQMPNGAEVVYGFDEGSHQLARVQVLSMLPTLEGLAPHLTAMHERYGAPSGIWDCADAGGISTRRFTWRRSHVGLADIVLLYGTRISLTLYVTSNEQMSASLRRAGCAPMAPDAIEQFPTTTPEQIQRAQEANEEERPR